MPDRPALPSEAEAELTLPSVKAITMLSVSATDFLKDIRRSITPCIEICGELTTE